ncbi:MAG: ankyrin repeat domain-containing protein [Firmicutes bacterium]|nr:ankyrin repeat domain-containing protein [Bacillota bacterium]
MSKIMKTVLLVLVALICSYQVNIKAASKGEYRITDIRIYKDTPTWKLALAVKRQDTKSIEKIAEKEPYLLNYQDPKYGATLLLWAVGTERYRSAEALLKCGADPDIASTGNTTYGGDTPLLVASGFSWVDRRAKKDPKFVKLLLKYGADPNKPYAGFNIPESKSLTEPGTSPLMQSIGCGIEKMKALVEAGADINYKTKSGNTAAITALNAGGPNATLEALQYAYYLIVEKKAKVIDHYYGRLSYSDPTRKFYPVDLLRYWIYPLDSEEYKIKLKIIEEFARQGVNYWETEINNRTLEIIKKRYPDTWEEYIKKY